MVEHIHSDGEEPAVTLDAFLSQSNATAVRLEPDEDARALIPHLDRLALIEVAFPKFRDGRGYSSARILREAGYVGELRAQGDVLVDQIVKANSFGQRHHRRQATERDQVRVIE